jgi:ankyrin repeat protein
MADLSSVYENEPAPSHVETGERRVPSRKKQSAYAAAFDTFAPAPNDPSKSEMSEISLDARQVFSSARHGKHKDVEVALIAGFDPSCMDSFGNTLFHVACQNGNKRIAKLAIKYGGDMDAQNLKGNTGVHFLFAYGYEDIGEYFIEKGASDSILNELGRNPRHGIK